MRLAIDTGGTHTDLVLLDEDTGKLYFDKVATTPVDLTIGIEAGIKSIITQTEKSYENIKEFCYATTLITNILVQNKSVKTGMLTTYGFRDLLEIGRAYRAWNIYDISMDKQKPQIPRYLRLTVKERINFKGEILEPLDEADVFNAGKKLVKEGVQSVAIVFLHSYMNPVHEILVKKIFEKYFPDILVSASCEISPEIREYERASTTALNAFAQPTMLAHINRLEEKLGKLGMQSNQLMMQCNGGLNDFQSIKKAPIMSSSSGPIAGVLAGRFIGNSLKSNNLITFDVGGTSTDISIIKDNKINITFESELEHHPIQIPMVDHSTIGAGGGSIVWIDSGQGLRVGPKSAGAQPGPVCYDMGGEEPTTTDAMLISGIINPDTFLGGKITLNLDKAKRIFEQKISIKLGLSLEQAAIASIRVTISNMVEGIKAVSVGRGLDPRDYDLIAFGGAGPLFASFIASQIDCSRVIIPPRPGITSAFGILTADITDNFVTTQICMDEDIRLSEMNNIYKTMETRAISNFKDRFYGQEVLLLRSIDLRYFGQSFELNIPVPQKKITREDIVRIRHAFYQKHEEVFGHFFKDKPVQYVKYRVTASIVRKQTDFTNQLLLSSDTTTTPLTGERTVILPKGIYNLPVYYRALMPKGFTFMGPSIVEQMDSTTLLLPNDSGKVTQNGSIIIERRK